MSCSTDFQSCRDVFLGRTSTRAGTRQRGCVLLTNTTLCRKWDLNPEAVDQGHKTGPVVGFEPSNS